MADHFEKIQKLPEKIDGVPNFRRVPGYKVYCCGQPTIKGYKLNPAGSVDQVLSRQVSRLSWRRSAAPSIPKMVR